MPTELSCKIVSSGAWGEHFADTHSLNQLLQGAPQTTPPMTGPKPLVIPANERRRAPLSVRLAVETSWQATENIGVSPQNLASVFVSGYGDTNLTDYMCKALASENKLLSPTKFHNSVHNAPAGYWTISTGAMRAANSVAGCGHSVSIALMEAFIQCQVENAPVLITFYDAPVAAIMRPVLDNAQAFAGSLIIYPTSSSRDGLTVTATLSSETVEWPSLRTTNTYLQQLYDKNPAAKLLCLFEKLYAPAPSSAPICLPLNHSSSMLLRFA